MTYDEFAKQYQSLFNHMMKYSPNTVGGRMFADKMADLADAHPEHMARLGAESGHRRPHDG